MKAFLEENASQCGFCTPGFIISLTAWLCAPGPKDEAQAMRAVDGNLCRCTGYGSIRRAATRLCSEFADLPEDPMERLKVLVEAGVMPGSVLDYAVYCRSPRLAKMPAGVSEGLAPGLQAGAPITIGGGTDYYVRNPHPEADFLPRFSSGDPALKSWGEENEGGSPWLKIGAGFTVSEFFALARLNELYPSLRGIEGEFASTLVRNLATIGGNLANASPVGDLTCLFMGLGARLELKDARGKSRRLGLEEFFLGYKKTALEPGELIAAVLLPARPGLLFSFSKIAKRRNLDIAAVNSTLSFRLEQGRIREPRLAAGGVGPTPLLLPQAAGIVDGAAVGRTDGSLDALLLAELAREAARAAAAEIQPIDDVRGSAEYRRRMMERMVLHHFIELFAEAGLDEELKP